MFPFSIGLFGNRLKQNWVGARTPASSGESVEQVQLGARTEEFSTVRVVGGAPSLFSQEQLNELLLEHLEQLEQLEQLEVRLEESRVAFKNIGSRQL